MATERSGHDASGGEQVWCRRAGVGWARAESCWIWSRMQAMPVWITTRAKPWENGDASKRRSPFYLIRVQHLSHPLGRPLRHVPAASEPQVAKGSISG